MHAPQGVEKVHCEWVQNRYQIQQPGYNTLWSALMLIGKVYIKPVIIDINTPCSYTEIVDTDVLLQLYKNLFKSWQLSVFFINEAVFSI